MAKRGNKGNRFGINMIGFCREHEAYLKEQMDAGADCGKLLKYHLVKLKWLQHERLIHLLVTMLTTIVLMFLVILLQMLQKISVVLLLAIIIVLLLFYFAHYFRLENTVQRWYVIAEKLYQKSIGK